MNRLDQGHLHPKLEVPRLTCLGQEKSHSNSLLKATIRNIYIPYERAINENARDNIVI